MIIETTESGVELRYTYTSTETTRRLETITVRTRERAIVIDITETYPRRHRQYRIPPNRRRVLSMPASMATETFTPMVHGDTGRWDGVSIAIGTLAAGVR